MSNNKNTDNNKTIANIISSNIIEVCKWNEEIVISYLKKIISGFGDDEANIVRSNNNKWFSLIILNNSIL